jgi:hypothetical protein
MQKITMRHLFTILAAFIMMSGFVGCGLFPQPKPSGQEEVLLQAVNPIKPSDVFTYGMVAGDVLTLNGNFEIVAPVVPALPASLHANKGYTLNGNIKLNGGSITAADPATLPAGTKITCTDNARLNACKNGKPSVSIPMVAVPRPDIAALKADYLPQSYTSTLQGNQTFNNSSDANAKLPVGATVLVKGNLTTNAKVVFENMVVVVEGNATFNQGVDLKNSVLIAKQAAFNGTNLTWNEATVITVEDLTVNASVNMSGNTTLATTESITMNQAWASTSQAALIAAKEITINNGGKNDVAGVVWAGGNITINGSLKLTGSVISGGAIRSNGQFKLAKLNKLTNVDIPGMEPEIDTSYAMSEGILGPGGKYEGLDGVVVEAPKDFDKTIRIRIERLDHKQYDMDPIVGYQLLSAFYRVTAEQPTKSWKNPLLIKENPFLIKLPIGKSSRRLNTSMLYIGPLPYINYEAGTFTPRPFSWGEYSSLPYDEGYFLFKDYGILGWDSPRSETALGLARKVNKTIKFGISLLDFSCDSPFCDTNPSVKNALATLLTSQYDLYSRKFGVLPPFTGFGIEVCSGFGNA